MATKQNVDVIYKTITHNSILFLRKAINELTKNYDLIASREDAIFSSVYIQLSLELAIKAYIMNKTGLKSILDPKQHKHDSDEEILDKFLKNEVRTKELESLKNFLKDARIFNIDSKSIKIIEKFQRYRNKLVHIGYNFSEEELTNFKADCIYVIVHIIIKMLARDKGVIPTAFYQEYLDYEEFERLIKYPLYVEQMKDMAREENKVVYYCPICKNETLSENKDVCYCCLSAFNDNQIYGFIDCDVCVSKESVIYDKLNIHNDRSHMIRGLCLYCKEDAIVFECPRCGIAYNTETNWPNSGCLNGCLI